MVLSKDGLSLNLVPGSLSVNDPNFVNYVKIAIRQNPCAILLAPDHIQQDGEIFMDCLRRNPLLVVLISDSNMSIDKKTAIYLVSQDERTYQFLPETLKQDQDVVIAMLKKNINAVDLLGQDNMSNEELMIPVLKIFPQCFNLLPFNLKVRDTIIEATHSGDDSEFSEYDIEHEEFAALYLEKSKVKSWLSTRKNVATSTQVNTTEISITTPYKENARLIMHFGNSYFRNRVVNLNNTKYTSNPESKFGRFPIKVDTIE